MFGFHMLKAGILVFHIFWCNYTQSGPSWKVSPQVYSGICLDPQNVSLSIVVSSSKENIHPFTGIHTKHPGQTWKLGVGGLGKLNSYSSKKEGLIHKRNAVRPSSRFICYNQYHILPTHRTRGRSFWSQIVTYTLHDKLVSSFELYSFTHN